MELFHPALLLVFLVVILTALSIRHHLNTRPERGEPMPLEYYTKLKRQDADKAVVDWNTRAEELLTEAGVECFCQTEVGAYYTYDGGLKIKQHRRLSLDCPLHAWQGLELAENPLT